MKLKEAIETQVLLGDGANGTYLGILGYESASFDFAVLENPDLVRQCHRAYLEAGSDFIETNSFQANALRPGHDLIDIYQLNCKAAEIAKSIAGEYENRYVLGAIGPSGKLIEPIGDLTGEELFAAIQHQAEGLRDGGVDGFILETFADLLELEIAVNAVKSVSDLPVIISKAFIEDGEALAEGLPLRAGAQMAQMGAHAIGANCIVGPQRMLDLIRQLGESCTLPIVALPTPGLPQYVNRVITYDAKPDYFAKAVARLVEEGASVIGGCCGTTPDHIAAIRSLIPFGQKRPAPKKVRRQELAEKKPLVQAQPSELSAKIQTNKFLISVELDVPRGLNIDRLLAGARKLKIAGVDVVDISDGARARLRMNPTAVSHLIQSDVGLETVMHFACRDRNILAIQSDLLGAHALGIRNILAITGDPANIGDYPSATSVFDVGSVGLVSILQGFNEGRDRAGNSIGMRCSFTIAVAYNPTAQDQKKENDRLQMKVDQGANLIYTQPIFSAKDADNAIEMASKVNNK